MLRRFIASDLRVGLMLYHCLHRKSSLVYKIDYDNNVVDVINEDVSLKYNTNIFKWTISDLENMFYVKDK